MDEAAHSGPWALGLWFLLGVLGLWVKFRERRSDPEASSRAALQQVLNDGAAAQIKSLAIELESWKRSARRANEIAKDFRHWLINARMALGRKDDVPEIPELEEPASVVWVPLQVKFPNG